MFISDTTTDDDTTNATHNNDMMIEVVVPHHHNHHHAHMSHSSGGPKKRAETWGQDETRSLISLRRDMDALFNTSKSNKHLWEQISLKMRDRGFERSATMCTDKWRNLLKEFKKVKQQNCSSNNGNRRSSGNGGGNNCSSNSNNVIGGKMSYYKEIEEILNERCRSTSSRQLDDGSGGGGNGNVNGNGNGNGNGGGGGGIHSSKVDTTFLNFSDKGIDDASIPFGPMEANGRPILNLETRLDHEGHPLAISTADTVAGGGVPTFWRETPGNGDDHSFDGRVIVVKWGDYTRRIGVDGTADAIKDVIRSAFGLRTKRAFWLEDDDQVVRSLDRDMPLGTYTLHLDEGMTIKLCHYEESDHIPYPGQTISHTEEKTFYTEEDFREFMNRRGWSSLRELSGYRNIDNLDDLRPDALYRGVT